jgi:hypothetical protein
MGEDLRCRQSKGPSYAAFEGLVCEDQQRELQENGRLRVEES